MSLTYIFATNFATCAAIGFIGALIVCIGEQLVNRGYRRTRDN